jgi:hypothetical protein
VSTDASFPTVPDLTTNGWELSDERVETVFKLSTASVVGATKLYDDIQTRAAVRSQTGIDHQWRFFFATALTFRPPLAPGIGPTMILPTVRSQAQSTFGEELRERGFENVDRGRRERTRTDSGDRLHLREFSATFEPDTFDSTLSIHGWVGVWHTDGFRIAAGAYPARPIAELLAIESPTTPLERTPEDYRDELLDLIRAIE